MSLATTLATTLFGWLGQRIPRSLEHVALSFEQQSRFGGLVINGESFYSNVFLQPQREIIERADQRSVALVMSVEPDDRQLA